MKSMEKADWIILRLLMTTVGYTSVGSASDTYYLSVGYLGDKYGFQVIDQAITALRKEFEDEKANIVR